MERASPPECHQHELGGIEASLHRDHSQGPLHRRVGYREDALRGLLRARPQLPGQGFHLRPDEVPVQLPLSAEEGVRGEPAQPDVGVGDRDARASPFVADRARIRSGALGPHPERPAWVHPRQRASPGANGVDVDDRYGHRLVGDLELPGVKRPAGAEGDVCGGASHVEGDDPIEAGAACPGECAHHPTRGT